MQRTCFAAIFSVLLFIVGCGDDSSNPAPKTVASNLSFPVRAAYNNIVGSGLSVNLVGQDNSEPVFETVQPLVGPAIEFEVPGTRDWTGTLTARSRAAIVTAALGTSTVAVDYGVTLVRSKDGMLIRDGLTIFYDATYRPLAAVTLQDNAWIWRTPLGPLPLSGLVGSGSGTVIAESCPLPIEYTTVFQCEERETYFTIDESGELVPVEAPAQGENAMASSWILDPDTANTAFLTFTYRTVASERVVAPTGVTTQFRMRIDSSGVYRGFEYIRSEDNITIRLQAR
jgi:hypothetical protein